MNKEQIYDEQISPLMRDIIAICKRDGIAMVASFAIPTDEEPDLRCSSSIPDENDDFPYELENARQALFGRPTMAAMQMTVEKADGSKELHVCLG